MKVQKFGSGKVEPNRAAVIELTVLHQRFERTYCFHLQGRNYWYENSVCPLLLSYFLQTTAGGSDRISSALSPADMSDHIPCSLFLYTNLAHSPLILKLKMSSEYSFEIFECSDKITPSHKPQYRM